MDRPYTAHGNPINFLGEWHQFVAQLATLWGEKHVDLFAITVTPAATMK